METMKLVQQYADEMIAIRRHIHQNPELSNEEFKTTELIKEKLTEYGVEIIDIGMPTGVLAILRGGKPGKTVAMREDIDALPMAELADVPYKSTVENVCHSCGHDIHGTVLLYAAKALAQVKDELCGNVVFMFQPAEEKGTGAKLFVEKKFYEYVKPDVFVGLHVSPEFPAGSIGLKRGPANASCDVFSIKVSGKGGHGAHPENCIDPIAISAYLLTQLQTVISRENHPVYPAVLTIGSIHAGKAPNIIPDFVEMGGTLRSLDFDSRTKMQNAIDRIVKNCCEAMRGSGEVFWDKGMPPLVNDDAVIDALTVAATETIGADHIVAIKNPSLGSEDFSYLFPQYAPGAQFRLGSGNDVDPNTRHGLHNSKNTFDDSCLVAGAAVLVQYARNFLK